MVTRGQAAGRGRRWAAPVFLSMAASFAGFLLWSASSALAAPTTPPDAPECTSPPAGYNLILGTPGDDTGATTLNGTAGKDVICGLGGNDTIHGNGGDDIIDGGLGTDTITGDGGDDTITYAGRTNPVEVKFKPGGGFGGEGCDVFHEVSLGTCTLPADPPGENDRLDSLETIVGGSGGDFLVGGQLDDTLNGGPGNAPDMLCGGLGEDTVDYSNRTAPVNVSLDGVLAPFPGPPPGQIGDPVRDNCTAVVPAQLGPNGENRDCVANDGEASEGDCVGRDIERVLGGSGNDTLTGSDPSPFVPDPNAIITGENVLNGGSGDDTLDGGGGPDVLIGGPGTDTVTYANRTESVTATIDGTANDGGDSDLNPVSLRRDSIEPDVENLTGGSGNDTLKGSDAVNTLTGGGGDDSLDGGGANDTLSGGSGNDNLGGAGGDDTLAGEAGNDSLDGGTGNDSLDGGADGDTLVGGLGADSLAGGDGTDVADYSSALVQVTVNPNGTADDGAAGEGDNVAADVEGAVGGIDDDLLIGNGGNGSLNGGPGDDTLDGGAGSDSMIGGAGVDTATYAGRTAAVTVTLDGLANDGVAGEGDNVDAEKVVGGSANDKLTGDAAANILDGGPGNDLISGGPGADLIHGGPGNDSLSGDAGRDILNGGDGNDTLKGGSDSDSLLGDAGNDSLDGGTQSDLLGGGSGTDTVSYAGRRRKVSVTTLYGVPNDGETHEGDTVKTDVESVKTGAGNDFIDAKDGLAGRVSCGRGRDMVKADAKDKVSSNCEVVIGRAGCKPRTSSVRMTASGVVRLSVRCPARASGRVLLRASRKAVGKSTTEAAKKKSSKMTIGRGSFSVRAGKAKTVKVKLSRKGRRAVQRHKRLRVEALVTLRKAGPSAQAQRRTVQRITIKAPRRHR